MTAETTVEKDGKLNLSVSTVALALAIDALGVAVNQARARVAIAAERDDGQLLSAELKNAEALLAHLTAARREFLKAAEQAMPSAYDY